MGDYAKYHCFGCKPRDEENIILKEEGKTILKEERLQQRDKILMDLSKVGEPRPTAKMTIVLVHLLDNEYISFGQFNDALSDYQLASRFIGKYQETMHREVIMNREIEALMYENVIDPFSPGFAII